MGMKTTPEVFIIESLDLDNERDHELEGKLISDILAMSGKSCKYYYIRTRKELLKILTLFDESKYRYLHLSCHGNNNALFTTFDEIPFTDLATILKPHLNNRRLFLSACMATNKNIAKALIPGSGCYSILGPAKSVYFSDAVVLWAALYQVMFKADRSTMKQSRLQAKAQEVADMFRVRLNYRLFS